MDHCEINGLRRNEFFHQDVIELIPAPAKLTEVQLKKQGSQGIFREYTGSKQHQVDLSIVEPSELRIANQAAPDLIRDELHLSKGPDRKIWLRMEFGSRFPERYHHQDFSLNLLQVY